MTFIINDVVFIITEFLLTRSEAGLASRCHLAATNSLLLVAVTTVALIPNPILSQSSLAASSTTSSGLL